LIHYGSKQVEKEQHEATLPLDQRAEGRAETVARSALDPEAISNALAVFRLSRHH
jgi:hypothetical protein